MIPGRQRFVGIAAAFAVLVLAAGCASSTRAPQASPASVAPSSTTASAPAPVVATPVAPAPTAASAAPAAPAPAPVAALPELFARIDTPRGPIRIRLMTREAPLSCANFVNLVQRGLYRRTAFHDWTRVLRQCGGPYAGFEPGYVIRREFSAKLMFDGAGKVAMQKAADGEHSHATQFFITVKEQSRWDLDIAIFGLVVSGQEVVDATQQGDAIRDIAIEGDAAPLLARFAREVAGWNAALDRAGTGSANHAR